MGSIAPKMILVLYCTVNLNVVQLEVKLICSTRLCYKKMIVIFLDAKMIVIFFDAFVISAKLFFLFYLNLIFKIKIIS